MSENNKPTLQSLEDLSTIDKSSLKLKKGQGKKKRTAEGREKYLLITKDITNKTKYQLDKLLYEKIIELKRVFDAVNDMLPEHLKVESPFKEEVELVLMSDEEKEHLKQLALKLVTEIPEDLFLLSIRDLDIKEPQDVLPAGFYRSTGGRVINPFTNKHLEAKKAVCDSLELISKCTPKTVVILKVSELNQISEREASIRYAEALKEYFNSKDFSDYKFINMARLDSIISRTFEMNKFGDAIKAIDVQNKMTGSYAPEEHKVLQLNVVVF